MSPPDRRPGPCHSHGDRRPRSGEHGERRAGRDTHDTFDERKVHRLMARLVGVDLPRDKRIEVALTYIFGIGKTRAHELLDATGVNPDMRVHELGDDELVKLRDYIEAQLPDRG